MRLIWLAALPILIAAGDAAANPYEAFIDVETEEDLYDLAASQQITDETFSVLVDLLQRGVDLSTASREELYSLPNLTYDDVDAILAYRAEQGFIRDPGELTGAKVITDDKLLAIAAFLIVRDPFVGNLAAHGFVQLQTGFTAGDDLAPPIGLRARMLVGKHLTAGVAATMTRLRAGEIVYDPTRDALITDAPGIQPHLPKAYVAFEDDKLAAIAGTYRIGFGQRLTFDNSSDYTPNGIYRDDQLFRGSGLDRQCTESTGELAASPCAGDYNYVTADLGWREALLGVAAGAKHLRLGQGWAQAYAWASVTPRSIYQYEIYDAADCADPRDDGDAACGATDVYVRPDGNPLDPAAELAYSTLPRMYREALVGGHASYFVSTRNYIGVTAYGAKTTWLIDDGAAGEDLALDFQEWSSRPSGGSFGAVGVTTAAGKGWVDVGAEITHSFDAMEVTSPSSDASGGGGPAAIVRAVFTSPKKREIEVSARYYDTDFINPFGRPIAASDEFEGQRARDEAGVRVRYTAQHGQLSLRGGLDAWRRLSSEVPKGEIYVRADVQASRAIRWGAWLTVQDKDLGAGGRGQCYETTFEFDELGEPVDCKGMQISSIARLRWQVDRRLTLSTQLQHQLLDDTGYPDGYRQDVSGWVTALWKPPVADDRLRLRARARYLSEDVADSTSLEESVSGSLDATMRMRAKDRLRVRFDMFVWLDQRDRTLERTPSPELTLWVQYEAKY